MYAAIIKTNSLTGNFYIPCGSDSYVKLDGRLNLSNSIEEAKQHFEKRNDFKGIALFHSIKDEKPFLTRGFGEDVPREPEVKEL